MDSAQCRCAICELLTQILRLLIWLEPESTQALIWYQCFWCRVLHLHIVFNAITYQRGQRVFPSPTRTMHSAGRQLPRTPCPAARPTTTHPTQGSTTTGIRATPAAALSETPGIASQSASVRELIRHQSAPPNPADPPDGPDARLQPPFAEPAAGLVTVGLESGLKTSLSI